MVHLEIFGFLVHLLEQVLGCGLADSLRGRKEEGGRREEGPSANADDRGVNLWKSAYLGFLLNRACVELAVDDLLVLLDRFVAIVIRVIRVIFFGAFFSFANLIKRDFLFFFLLLVVLILAFFTFYMVGKRM